MAELQINQFRGKPITTPVHYNKHWKETKIKYKVLSISQLSKAWIQTIKATVKTVITGDAAKDFVYNTARDLALQGLKSDWAYKVIDNLGHVGVLEYRGIQVALFFKRQVSEIMPVVGEKPPENPITDPDEVWQRLDILGSSAKKANVVLKNYHDQLEEDIAFLERQVTFWKQKHSQTEDKLLKYVQAELFKKEQQKKKEQAERDKLKPKRKKSKTDRLCMICGCYENVHNFKGQKCLGCDGGKPKCESCAFRPKKVRIKKEKGKANVKRKR